MASAHLWERLATAATIMVATAGVCLAGSVVWQHHVATEGTGGQAPREDRRIPDWRELAELGHRMGPDNAEVTVLYFGDYECPYCAKADLDLGALREEFPENLAVVFLHFPLATHPRSHALARMAECGAHQDSFEAVHSLLFPTDELAEMDPDRVARDAQVPRVDQFLDCAAGDEELPGIEEDKSIGEELGIRSTPRFILQGVLLGASPDSAGLSELVRGHLEKGGL